MGTDGTGKQQITSKGTNGYPAWSIDNRFLYYLSNRDGRLQIYRQEIVTGREEPVYQEGSYGRPVILADGRVAYVQASGGQHKLFVGGQTIFSLDRRFDFQWSPDQTQVLIDPLQDPRVLYTVDLNSGKTREVAGTKSWNGSWSPDGQILFASDRLGVAFIFVAGRDGTNARTISPTDKWSQCPSWSPDGRWIAYVAADGPNWNLYLMSSNGTGRRQVGNFVNSTKSAIWEPNSRRAVFESNRYGDWDIFTMDINGNELQLTSSDAKDYDPAWSY
jgi:TolB protein